MLTDACLRDLLRHGPCSPGNVHVSHPGPICLASMQMKSILLLTHYSQEGLAIKAERMKKKLTGGKKKVEIDEIKVNIQSRRIHMLTVGKR